MSENNIINQKEEAKEKELVAYFFQDNCTEEHHIHIMSKIKPEDIRSKSSRLVFKAVSDIILVKGSQNVNEMTVKDMIIEQNPNITSDVADDMVSMYDSIYVSNDINYLNTLIDEVHKNTKIDEFSDKLTKLNKLMTRKRPTEIYDLLNDIVQNWNITEKNSFVEVHEVVTKLIKNIEEGDHFREVTGLATDFYELDKITNGFQKGNLIVLAARPGMGKTALALSIARKASISNQNKDEAGKILFYSLEMSNEELSQRILSAESNVELGKIKAPKFLTARDKKFLTIAKNKIDKLDIVVNDEYNVYLDDLLIQIKQFSKTQNLKCVIIDYLQLLLSSRKANENRQQEVTKISRSLKLLSKELNIPIIALSQLSRSVEKRESKKPILSDLRESGAIEQDADMILFLYKEEDEGTQENNYNDYKVELLIAKHRNGSTGKVNLLFKKPFCSFENYFEDNDYKEGNDENN